MADIPHVPCHGRCDHWRCVSTREVDAAWARYWARVAELREERYRRLLEIPGF